MHTPLEWVRYSGNWSSDIWCVCVSIESKIFCHIFLLCSVNNFIHSQRNRMKRKRYSFGSIKPQSVQTEYANFYSHSTMARHESVRIPWQTIEVRKKLKNQLHLTFIATFNHLYWWSREKKDFFFFVGEQNGSITIGLNSFRRKTANIRGVTDKRSSRYELRWPT